MSSASPFCVLSAPLEEGGNYFHQDPVLRALVGRLLPEKTQAFALPHLEAMGESGARRISALAREADRHGPVHRPFDRFGNRIDEIVYHPSYREMETLSYGAGMVALKYDPEIRKAHPGTRHLVGFSISLLFGQAESGLFCPVCMTDGAARVLERFGTDDQKARVLPHLVSRDLARLYRGAMFLTEKQGGSDVGATATRAVKEGGVYRLYGEKWFCSNVDAEAILTLARPDGAPAGTRGLGLFLVLRDLPGGGRNGIRIDRIKDKLGVRSMPTGEVTLEGSLAEPVGPLDAGFKCMTDMINLSRLYNAVASVAIARRCLYESTRYLRARKTFGRTAIEHPLLRETLADLNAEEIAAKHLVLQMALHLDRADEGSASDLRLIRILTPLAKYTTGKLAVTAASEGIELLGGNGYIEDFDLPRLLRDAQVLPVWEGTTNILVLDALRACKKERAHEALLEETRRRCEAAPAELAPEVDGVRALAGGLSEQVAFLLSLSPERQAPKARRLTDRLVQVFALGLLLESAAGSSLPARLSRAALRRLLARASGGEVETPAEDLAALVDLSVGS